MNLFSSQFDNNIHCILTLKMTKESMDVTTMALPGAPSSLCFNKDEFMRPNFNAEQFLVECRRRVPLETLRDDLSIYLKILQSAMIELINKDYADFVNLSTNLVGLDKAINNLMHPLGQLKHDVLKVKTEMDEAINAVQGKLRHQEEIKQKKIALSRLRSIIHSVEKMEKLLGIQKSEDSVVQYPSELNGQLIERVATQFNKLQFFVNKSRGQELVEEIKPRIANITTTLQYSLEGSFRKGLETSDTNVLRQCLRTYTTIDKMRDAENLFRQYSVRPYMEEVVNEEFLSKQGLKGMYAGVLDFIPNYCKILQEVTSGNVPGGGEVVRGYDFMVHSVWPEIVTNIEAQVPSIFAPGNPNVFHERYVCSMEFIGRFESLCGSQASVKKLRVHPSYNTFMSKWSLPVYFQIRFQEIAGNFESTLTLPVITSTTDSKFQLQCTEDLWYCLHQCWSPDVYLPALCHRFWKLSLQLLARYSRWLAYVGENHLVKQETKTDNKIDALKNGAGEPILNGDINLPTNPVLSVRDIVLLLSDIYKLHDEFPDVYKNVITPLLVQLNFQDTGVLNESLGDAQQVLLSSIVKCENHITQELIGQCATQLKNVNDIPRLYRRTNREKPSKATAYVEAMVKPVRIFCDEHFKIVKKEKHKEWISIVLKSVCQQYLTITTDVLTSVKKMEESLKRLKQKKKSETKGLSDDDKIRLQLQLDIIEFGNQIEAMDINKASVGYNDLFTVVKNATGAT